MFNNFVKLWLKNKNHNNHNKISRTWDRNSIARERTHTVCKARCLHGRNMILFKQAGEFWVVFYVRFFSQRNPNTSWRVISRQLCLSSVEVQRTVIKTSTQLVDTVVWADVRRKTSIEQNGKRLKGWKNNIDSDICTDCNQIGGKKDNRTAF